MSTSTSRSLGLALAVAAAGIAGRAAPPPEPPEHQLRWMARVELGEEVLVAADPGAVEARMVIDLDARGQPGLLLVEAAAAPLSPFRLVHGRFAMAGPASSLPEARRDRATWHAEGRLADLLIPDGDRVLVRAPFWLPVAWEQALHGDGGPPALNGGYPMLLREVVTFVLPPGMRRLELPEPLESRGGPLEWRLQWTWDGQSGRFLEVHLEAVLARGGLGRDDVAALAHELRRLHGALARGARYQR